jgi:hypothetical protein
MNKISHLQYFRHSGKSRNPLERESQYHCHKLPAFAGMTDLLGGWLQ